LLASRNVTDAHSANLNEFTREFRSLTKTIDHLSVGDDCYEVGIEGHINIRSRKLNGTLTLFLTVMPVFGVAELPARANDWGSQNNGELPPTTTLLSQPNLVL
jgi:hypothetical protein